MGSSGGTHQFDSLRGVYDTRLLHLNPGKQNDELSGRVQTISLDAPLPCAYEALSYEWRNAERNHKIQLDDGSHILITESLHHALQDLRHEIGGTRAIWADGVCINQDRTVEREQQVALMGSIYRNAIRVITYIGPETDGVKEAIAFARYLTAFSNSGIYSTDARFHMPGEVLDLGLPPMDDPRWPGLKQLLLRQWVSVHLRYSKFTS